MIRPTLVLIQSLALSFVVSTYARAGDWPAWRGPLGTGVSEETGLPERWSRDENVRWKIALPGPGNSTPIVWGDRIYVTCASEEGAIRELLVLNRQTGKELWRKSVSFEGKETTHKTNPYCSSSPTTDGERVYVWHGSAGLYAYDLDGNEVWKKDLGRFEHIWGNASSPVVYKDLLILSAGPGLRAFVAALDKRTGEERWRFEPPGIRSEKFDEFRGSWSTPVLHTSDGRDELLLSLPLKLYALDPTNGKEIWSCGGLSKLAYTSPLIGKDAIVAMSGYHGPALAVRTGGRGDVTETHRLWLHEEKKKVPQRVGSGVVVGDHVYILNEPGIAWCIEIATGDIKWQERLGGKSWSSMLHADGRLYAANMDGTTFVLAADPAECKVLATNKLGELVRASPAVSNGQLFLRTYDHLWCIEEKTNP